jgi:hypothetical protein
MPWASGTRASPQKNRIAITTESEPRTRWIRSTAGAGHGVRVARKTRPPNAAPAIVRHSKAL